MRDAAVGFHCPDCVAEGARTTRQGRTAYGGVRSGNPALTSMVLIGLNAAVFVAVVASGGLAGRLIDRFALMLGSRCDPIGQSGYFPRVPNEASCVTDVGGTWVIGVADGAVWQLVTSMFTHVEIWHIGFNMLALWFLGPQLELAIGRVRFLALYLLSGLAGAAMVVWLTGSQVQTFGASGAIFGLMGALLVVVVKVGGNVSTIAGWLLINAVITLHLPQHLLAGPPGRLPRRRPDRRRDRLRAPPASRYLAAGRHRHHRPARGRAHRGPRGHLRLTSPARGVGSRLDG